MLNLVKNTTIMSFSPADNIQDLQNFGEFGGVNPSISCTHQTSSRFTR